MRLWVDMTAPAHPLVLRPLIKRFRGAGHEVRVTARDYAQTLETLRRLEIRTPPSARTAERRAAARCVRSRAGRAR